MKPFLKQALIPAVSAIAGGLIVFAAVKYTSNTQAKIDDTHFANKIINASYDDFFANDPFEHMRNMHKHFEKQMGNTNPIAAISTREDDDSIYYDIAVDDVKSTSIDTKVHDGYITIIGTTEKKEDYSDGNDREDYASRSFYKSTFNKTFPLPEHVDANKLEMSAEDNKIILKLPKIKV